MYNHRPNYIASLFALLCLCVASLAHAEGKLEDLAIMALGPLDGRAVVKTLDGKLHVLTVGATMPGTEAKLLQILPDKLVLEDMVGKEGKPKIKQTVWMNKGAKPGVPGTIQRFDTQGPEPVKREVTIMKPVGFSKILSDYIFSTEEPILL